MAELLTEMTVRFDDLTVLSEGGVDIFVFDLIEDPQPPPYHITVEGRRFAFTARTFLVQGHSAYMPGALREVEAAGQLPLLVEREDRYLLYIHDPVVEAEAAAEAEAEAAN